jgi:Ca2+-transporting ATPase
MEERELASLDKYNGLPGIAQMLGTDLITGNPSVSILPEHRRLYGENILPDPTQKTFLQLFCTAMRDKMLILLMATAIISVILWAIFDRDDTTGWIDGASILITVFVIAAVHSITDYRQQKAFTSIFRMKNDILVSVIRAGERVRIPASEVVVGDLLYLDAGNKLVADGLYVDGRGLKLNESETLPIHVGRQRPFMWGGSTVEEM